MPLVPDLCCPFISNDIAANRAMRRTGVGERIEEGGFADVGDTCRRRQQIKNVSFKRTNLRCQSSNYCLAVPAAPSSQQQLFWEASSWQDGWWWSKRKRQKTRMVVFGGRQRVEDGPPFDFFAADEKGRKYFPALCRTKPGLPRLKSLIRQMAETISFASQSRNHSACIGTYARGGRNSNTSKLRIRRRVLPSQKEG